MWLPAPASGSSTSLLPGRPIASYPTVERPLNLGNFDDVSVNNYFLFAYGTTIKMHPNIYQ